MRIITVGLIILMGVNGAATVTGQEAPLPGLTHEEVQVAFSALHWYIARDPDLRTEYAALVISSKTTGGAPLVYTQRDSASPPLGEGLSPKEVDFPDEARGEVSRAAGIPVVVCDSLDMERSDLCGAARPWVWFVFSNVEIEGDRAAVMLEKRWLDWGHPISLERPSRHSETYALQLRREGSSWHVVSFHVSGVT